MLHTQDFVPIAFYRDMFNDDQYLKAFELGYDEKVPKKKRIQAQHACIEVHRMFIMQASDAEILNEYDAQ